MGALDIALLVAGSLAVLGAGLDMDGYMGHPKVEFITGLIHLGRGAARMLYLAIGVLLIVLALI